MTAFEIVGVDTMGRPVVVDGKPVPVAQFSAQGRPRYSEEQRVLFVVRESSTSAERELAGLATQVLLKHDYREGIPPLIAAGANPLREPHRWNGVTLRVDHGRISLVQAGNSWVLYALSSAAKDTDGEQNAFTEELVKTIQRVRPHVIVTGSVSRLVRHAHHVSRVSRALSLCRPILECSERYIDFRNSQAPDVDFHDIATQAMRDRSLILTRMENGNAAAVYQKRFPFQGNQLPDGYRRLDDGTIVLADAAQVETIRQCLIMLSDSSVTKTVAARHLVASQSFRPRKAGANVKTTRPLSLDGAVAVISRLLLRPDVYQTGVFTLSRRLASTPQAFADQEVPQGGLRGLYRFELPLPEGGWADPAVFAGIRKRGQKAVEEERHRLATTTGEKHHRQLPLTGYRWRVGDEEWGLFARQSNKPTAKYALLSRPVDSKARGAASDSQSSRNSMRRKWGYPKNQAEGMVCRVRAGDLHRSVADTFGTLTDFNLRSIGWSAAGGLGPGQMGIDLDADERKAAEVEVRSAKADLKTARTLLYGTAPDDPNLRIFRDDYAEAVKAVSRAEERLHALQTAPTASSDHAEPNTVEVDAAQALHPLALLAATSHAMLREDVLRLEAILHDFTVTFDAATGELVWSASLQVPTADQTGSCLVGPVMGRVAVLPLGDNRAARAPAQDAALRRATAPVALGPADAALVSDGLRRRGFKGHAVQTLMGAPAETRAAVVCHLLGKPAPERLDPGFVRLAVAAYGPDSSSRQFAWNAPSSWRQEALDVLSRQGPQDRFALMEALGVMDLSWEDLFYKIRGSEGTWLGAVLTHRHFTAPSSQGGQRVTVRCRRCPHCGANVDVVARVPECPAGLLCSACLRMPFLDSPVFPPAYRKLAANPQKRRVASREAPAWWSTLQQVTAEHPDATVTILAAMLNRSRSEIEEATACLRIPVKAFTSASEEWTSARLREEYLVKDRKLVDLADEMGISSRALSKRLQKAGILKVRRQGK